MISWTWNDINLSLWIRIDVKTWRTVRLNNKVKTKTMSMAGASSERNNIYFCILT